MNLSKELFWDTDYNKIDWDKSYHWVICRVLEYGKLEDWKAMRKYYGDEKIIEAAVNASYLSKKSTHFISNLFNVPLTEFRVYHIMKDKPDAWRF